MELAFRTFYLTDRRYAPKKPHRKWGPPAKKRKTRIFTLPAAEIEIPENRLQNDGFSAGRGFFWTGLPHTENGHLGPKWAYPEKEGHFYS